MAMMMRMKNSFFFNSFAITVKKKKLTSTISFIFHIYLFYLCRTNSWHHFVLITSYFDARHASFYIYTTSMQVIHHYLLLYICEAPNENKSKKVFNFFYSVFILWE